MDFTLVTDGGDEGECDDLGVAQLDLSSIRSRPKQLIRFLDVNGEELAELEVEMTYSEKLMKYFESDIDE
ncbi:unnamed protein product [Anisakis simplex]|uniref:Uncharacterized protein n=1 Tax=Anisakis simplex TaxID=6269 RepID=A0A3P6Q9L9_ANISI|nr:unnamed protein product [Anisakis simplex]